jgi:hypothetical protein
MSSHSLLIVFLVVLYPPSVMVETLIYFQTHISPTGQGFRSSNQQVAVPVVCGHL